MTSSITPLAITNNLFGGYFFLSMLVFHCFILLYRPILFFPIICFFFKLYVKKHAGNE
jgi:hypothetical protein